MDSRILSAYAAQHPSFVPKAMVFLENVGQLSVKTGNGTNLVVDLHWYGVNVPKVEAISLRFSEQEAQERLYSNGCWVVWEVVRFDVEKGERLLLYLL